MQWRFGQRHGARAARLLQHKRFRAAYDFLVLRASCGEVDRETVDWWTEIQNAAAGRAEQALGLKGARVAAARRRGRRGGRASTR